MYIYVCTWFCGRGMEGIFWDSSSIESGKIPDIMPASRRLDVYDGV
jgi:hypothetical protein